MLMSNATETVAQSYMPEASPQAAAASASAPDAPSVEPVDSVSLSAAAQQALASPKIGVPDNTPPALAKALQAVNDDSGRTSVKDQLSAYDLLTEYASASTAADPAQDPVLQSFQASPFAKHVHQVQTLMDTPVFSHDVGRALLDRLNRLTPDDQQIALHDQNQLNPGAFASVDSLKANDQARSAVQKVTDKIFAKFGGDDLTKLSDPRIAHKPAFQAFLTLVSANPASDGWTAEATKVLSDIAKTLDLTLDDPRQKDAAHALETLNAPRPVTAGQASALRTFKRIHDDLQKARDAEAAKRAGQPRHTERRPRPRPSKRPTTPPPPTSRPPPTRRSSWRSRRLGRRSTPTPDGLP